MHAPLDASHKAHVLCGTIKLVAPRNAFETAEREKKETFLKFETNQNLFLHQKNYFYSGQTGLGSREECDQQSYEPSLVSPSHCV